MGQLYNLSRVIESCVYEKKISRTIGSRVYYM